MLINIIKKRRYFDSVHLMSIANRLKEHPCIKEASLMMGTDSNKSLIREVGLLDEKGEKAGPEDLLIALKAEKRIDDIDGILEDFLTRTEEHKACEFVPHTLEGGFGQRPGINLVLISIPGEYVKREAMRALEKGSHVMIFSDNVSVDDEVAIKKNAASKGLLVMGPDCGTAIINGAALGFANRIKRGDIGIVAASGTGLQETSVLISRSGCGISQAIGTGGRDLSEKVGGASMIQGIMALEEDPTTKTILLVSKPPARAVETKILDIVKDLKKDYIVTFLGGKADEAGKRGLIFAHTLEEGAGMAVAAARAQKYRAVPFKDPMDDILARAEAEWKNFKKGEKYIRGIFSGGTLCDETMLILRDLIGDTYSNVPLKEDLRLTDSWKSLRHSCVDLGDDEFTAGVPHPMIDFSLRNQRILQEAQDPEAGVILLDIVLGYGSNPDPAGALGNTLYEAKKIALKTGRFLSVIVYICGTADDPQDIALQKKKIEESGAVVMESNAMAARFASLVISKGGTKEKIWKSA